MTDWLLDTTTDDLWIQGGDIVIGDSTVQNQRNLILAAPNDWPGTPADGVDLKAYLLDEGNVGELRGRIVREFEADGMKAVSVTGRTFETLDVNATY